MARTIFATNNDYIEKITQIRKDGYVHPVDITAVEMAHGLIYWCNVNFLNRYKVISTAYNVTMMFKETEDQLLFKLKWNC